MERGRHLAAVLFGSLALHVLVCLSLTGKSHALVPRPDPVRITVMAAQPSKAVIPDAPAEAAPPAPAAPERSVRKVARRPREGPPPVVARPEAKPAPAEPVDFTGVTLTGNGAGWASVTGNGQASSGPLSAPPRGTHAGTGHGRGEGGEATERSGPPVIGLASLSRPPRAPGLDGELLQNYPRSARDQGRPGHAVVRARIMPDGRVDRTQVLVASAPEFGRACQRTLSGSRWTPPLDARGNPVATDVSYTCQFEVTR